MKAEIPLSVDFFRKVVAEINQQIADGGIFFGKFGCGDGDDFSGQFAETLVVAVSVRTEPVYRRRKL